MERLNEWGYNGDMFSEEKEVEYCSEELAGNAYV